MKISPAVVRGGSGILESLCVCVCVGGGGSAWRTTIGPKKLILLLQHWPIRPASVSTKLYSFAPPFFLFFLFFFQLLVVGFMESTNFSLAESWRSYCVICWWFPWYPWTSHWLNLDVPIVLSAGGFHGIHEPLTGWILTFLLCYLLVGSMVSMNLSLAESWRSYCVICWWFPWYPWTSHWLNLDVPMVLSAGGFHGIHEPLTGWILTFLLCYLLVVSMVSMNLSLAESWRSYCVICWWFPWYPWTSHWLNLDVPIVLSAGGFHGIHEPLTGWILTFLLCYLLVVSMVSMNLSLAESWRSYCVICWWFPWYPWTSHWLNLDVPIVLSAGGFHGIHEPLTGWILTFLLCYLLVVSMVSMNLSLAESWRSYCVICWWFPWYPWTSRWLNLDVPIVLSAGGFHGIHEPLTGWILTFLLCYLLVVSMVSMNLSLAESWRSYCVICWWFPWYPWTSHWLNLDVPIVLSAGGFHGIHEPLTGWILTFLLCYLLVVSMESMNLSLAESWRSYCVICWWFPWNPWTSHWLNLDVPIVLSAGGFHGIHEPLTGWILTFLLCYLLVVSMVSMNLSLAESWRSYCVICWWFPWYPWTSHWLNLDVPIVLSAGGFHGIHEPLTGWILTFLLCYLLVVPMESMNLSLAESWRSYCVICWWFPWNPWTSHWLNLDVPIVLSAGVFHGIHEPLTGWILTFLLCYLLVVSMVSMNLSLAESWRSYCVICWWFPWNPWTSHWLNLGVPIVLSAGGFHGIHEPLTGWILTFLLCYLLVVSMESMNLSLAESWCSYCVICWWFPWYPWTSHWLNLDVPIVLSAGGFHGIHEPLTGWILTFLLCYLLVVSMVSMNLSLAESWRSYCVICWWFPWYPWTSHWLNLDVPIVLSAGGFHGIHEPLTGWILTFLLCYLLVVSMVSMNLSLAESWRSYCVICWWFPWYPWTSRWLNLDVPIVLSAGGFHGTLEPLAGWILTFLLCYLLVVSMVPLNLSLAESWHSYCVICWWFPWYPWTSHWLNLDVPIVLSAGGFHGTHEPLAGWILTFLLCYLLVVSMVPLNLSLAESWRSYCVICWWFPWYPWTSRWLNLDIPIVLSAGGFHGIHEPLTGWILTFLLCYLLVVSMVSMNLSLAESWRSYCVICWWFPWYPWTSHWLNLDVPIVLSAGGFHGIHEPLTGWILTFLLCYLLVVSMVSMNLSLAESWRSYCVICWWFPWYPWTSHWLNLDVPIVLSAGGFHGIHEPLTGWILTFLLCYLLVVSMVSMNLSLAESWRSYCVICWWFPWYPWTSRWLNLDIPIVLSAGGFHGTHEPLAGWILTFLLGYLLVVSMVSMNLSLAESWRSYCVICWWFPWYPWTSHWLNLDVPIVLSAGGFHGIHEPLTGWILAFLLCYLLVVSMESMNLSLAESWRSYCVICWWFPWNPWTSHWLNLDVPIVLSAGGFHGIHEPLTGWILTFLLCYLLVVSMVSMNLSLAESWRSYCVICWWFPWYPWTSHWLNLDVPIVLSAGGFHGIHEPLTGWILTFLLCYLLVVSMVSMNLSLAESWRSYCVICWWFPWYPWTSHWLNLDVPIVLSAGGFHGTHEPLAGWILTFLLCYLLVVSMVPLNLSLAESWRSYCVICWWFPWYPWTSRWLNLDIPIVLSAGGFHGIHEPLTGWILTFLLCYLLVVSMVPMNLSLAESWRSYCVICWWFPWYPWTSRWLNLDVPIVLSAGGFHGTLEPLAGWILTFLLCYLLVVSMESMNLSLAESWHSYCVICWWFPWYPWTSHWLNLDVPIVLSAGGFHGIHEPLTGWILTFLLCYLLVVSMVSMNLSLAESWRSYCVICWWFPWYPWTSHWLNLDVPIVLSAGGFHGIHEPLTGWILTFLLCYLLVVSMVSMNLSLAESWRSYCVICWWFPWYPWTSHWLNLDVPIVLSAGGFHGIHEPLAGWILTFLLCYLLVVSMVPMNLSLAESWRSYCVICWWFPWYPWTSRWLNLDVPIVLSAGGFHGIHEPLTGWILTFLLCYLLVVSMESMNLSLAEYWRSYWGICWWFPWYPWTSHWLNLDVPIVLSAGGFHGIHEPLAGWILTFLLCYLLVV